jgi:F-type H+-transporting ATPase subunit delta
MANLDVIAKPYAKAAFEFANEHNALRIWSSQLVIVADLVDSDTIARIITSPMLSQSEVVAAIADQLDTNFVNFLKLIAQNKRLQVLPSIAIKFESIRNAQNNSKTAKVILAYETDESIILSLKKSLEKRFDCSIDMDINIDPAIMGGAIVKVGDIVIDSSISGRLEKIKSILLS